MENTDGKSRGRLRISHLFDAQDIGIQVPEPHTNRAIRIFLDRASPADGKAIVPRVSQLPRGVLLYQENEGEPASGAIYLYLPGTGAFFLISFDADYDHLTVADYEALVQEYGLMEYAADPGLIFLNQLEQAGFFAEA